MSDDEVINFMVTEAVRLKVIVEERESEQEHKAKEWREDESRLQELQDRFGS